MKKISVVIALTLVLAILAGTATSEILSDSVFEMATVSLSASKVATFSAITFSFHDSIKVTEVKLQQYIGSTWSTIATLEAPADEATNVDLYGATKNYSGSIGTGKVRLKVTFYADGHTITRYSNQRTY